MGRPKGSKNKSKVQAPSPSPERSSDIVLTPPIPITVVKSGYFREKLPPSKRVTTPRKSRSSPVSLAKKRLDLECRDYCIMIVEMATKQGVITDLVHLMHAFKLILQGHHGGMASDEPSNYSGPSMKSELTDQEPFPSEEKK